MRLILRLANFICSHFRFCSRGDHLVTGSQDGRVLCYDLRTIKPNDDQVFDAVSALSSSICLHTHVQSAACPYIAGDCHPLLAHQSSVNGIRFPHEQLKSLSFRHLTRNASLNPVLPVLATASGQRHFVVRQPTDDDGSDEDDGLFHATYDNTVKLWAVPLTHEESAGDATQ